MLVTGLRRRSKGLLMVRLRIRRRWWDLKVKPRGGVKREGRVAVGV